MGSKNNRLIFSFEVDYIEDSDYWSGSKLIINNIIDNKSLLIKTGTSQVARKCSYFSIAIEIETTVILKWFFKHVSK